MLDTELPTQGTGDRGQGAVPCTRCPTGWERPLHYCFPSGRLLLGLPIFTERKQGLISQCWERRMQMA